MQNIQVSRHLKRLKPEYCAFTFFFNLIFSLSTYCKKKFDIHFSARLTNKSEQEKNWRGSLHKNKY